MSGDTEKESFSGLLHSETRDNEEFTYEPKQKTKRGMRFFLNALSSAWLPWLLTTSLASLSVYLSIKLATLSPSFGTYEKGFMTDFGEYIPPITPERIFNHCGCSPLVTCMLQSSARI
jgi:hypothetical protein